MTLNEQEIINDIEYGYVERPNPFTKNYAIRYSFIEFLKDCADARVYDGDFSSEEQEHIYRQGQDDGYVLACRKVCEMLGVNYKT